MTRNHRPVVFKPSQVPAFVRGKGVRTRYLVTTKEGSAELLNGITEFDPGGAIPLHWHNCEESVLVLEGWAVFEVEGTSYRLSKGDVTWVPPGVQHRFENRSTTKRMAIFWTYGSIDATRTIASTGKTFTVGSIAEHAALLK